MRRPPGLWILLSAGVVWLSLQDVYGIRATSLIFGKSSTTTTTTTTAPEHAEASEDETVTTELNADANATKPTLTGNPQIDYIWDPNLPKELNGYNLSDYPFYERVPEDIDFKCDGLHDGFYASVAHKCQVYHHCLYGTRYDFLCANYTAFDQRTFICHFASEIDCVNSKKFWHRNDALYKAASTTTVKPFVIYTTPPQPAPTPAAPQPAPSGPANPSGPGLRRPAGGRRPFRRRPQFDYYDDDYYDDYYEERPRSNRGRKRPRPRPRPVYYDDEYDGEYEDERYERRGGGRRNEKRRPYQRRPNGKRRNQDRDKNEYDEDTDRLEDEDFKPQGRRKTTERKPYDDESDEERYPENKKQNKRRPTDERVEEDENKPRKGQRRPVSDDYEEDTFQRNDSRDYNRPRKNEEDRRRARPKEEPKTIIKPVSGTIYDRPRVAPKIKLPVPKNEADKYAYKPAGSTPAVVEEDVEYYDDYEDVLPKRKNNRPDTRSETKIKDDSRKETSTNTRQRPRRPESSYESSTRPRYKETRPRSKPVSVEYYDDYEEYDDDIDHRKPAKSDERIGKSTTTTTTTTERPIEKVKQPIVRLVKRPFLPSRGGNPYAARGLQPVGSKAVDGRHQSDDPVREILEENSGATKDEATADQKYRVNYNLESDEIKPVFKPSPAMINVPVRKLVPISSDSFRSHSYNTEEANGSKVTKKPKLPEQNPLDINEEEYDVTLNDALNPTLPNLPVRDSPVGFIPSDDYAAVSNLQRSRYVLEPVASQTGSDYSYQSKPLVARDRPVSSEINYNGQYSSYRETYRPRRVQHQTEALYSRY